MAKNMALIENGVVVNVLWCSDAEPETKTLIDPGERPVGIGDIYEEGVFYRGGEEVLTPLEEEQKRNYALVAENAELMEAMAAMVDDIYNQDIEQMEE